jgi:hypothetical protein
MEPTIMEFKRVETPTIPDGVIIKWQGVVDYPDAPEIVASEDGVTILGTWPVMDKDDIADVKNYLDIAVKEYLSFKMRQL